jgi:hypothetical protein
MVMILAWRDGVRYGREGTTWRDLPLVRHSLSSLRSTHKHKSIVARAALRNRILGVVGMMKMPIRRVSLKQGSGMLTDWIRNGPVLFVFSTFGFIAVEFMS